MKKIILLLMTIALTSVVYGAVCGFGIGPSCVPEIDNFGLMAWYSFNGTDAAVLVDHSGNGRNMTCINTPTVGQADPYGGTDAWDFERDSNEFCNDTITGNLNLTNFTVSGWLKLETSTSTEQNFFVCSTNTSAPKFSINANSGTLRAGINGSGADLVTNNPLNTAEWFHIGFTRKGTEIKIYVNGTINGSTNITAGKLQACSLQIGRQPASENHKLDGDLADITVWNRSLNSSEMICLYNGTCPAAQAADPCDCPTSGDFILGAGNDCYITTPCDLNGNDLVLKDTANITIISELLNIKLNLTDGSHIDITDGSNLTWR